MLRLLCFLPFICASISTAAQGNELIYKKIIIGYSYELAAMNDSSGYVISFGWSGLLNTPNVNIGVWTDTTQSILIDDVYYGRSVVVYNSDFEPEGVMIYEGLAKPDLYPISLNQTILRSNKQLISNDASELLTIPFITDYPSSTYGQSVVIDYNSVSNTNTGIMNLSSPLVNYNQTEPYKGYYTAAYGDFPPRPDNKASAVIGDSIFISYLNLYHTQLLNETQPFSNWGGQVNMLRTQQNLQTNELITQQIGSSTGSLATFLIEPAKNSSALFRTGLVRGNNTPVSVSGAQVEMSPNDSLYHVFITKESETGETEWLTELYAYNNTLADTLLSSAGQLMVQNTMNSILHKNDNLYISSRVTAMANIGDSLLYRDFLGQSALFTEFIPNYGYNSDVHQFPFTESKIYKLDENGNIDGKLTYVNSLVSYETSFNVGGFQQPNHLFEVSDKLAWVHSYYALGDTTIQFTYVGADGSEQNTAIDFPAGQGSYILWLDDDLNILDHWLIPFQNSTIGGITINSVIPYKGDTLLIQGILNLNTTTNLNPFDDTELFTADAWSSFFAFYSAPEILTSTKTSKKSTTFNIYPNPVSNNLRVMGIDSRGANYIIYDLSGRALREGRISQNELINVANLNSGMYIIWIDSENGGGTAKFVVE